MWGGGGGGGENGQMMWFLQHFQQYFNHIEPKKA